MVWWIFEPIPIPATSLLPLAALPLLGILDSKQLSAAYGHPLILLLLSGFLLSTALTKCGAHRRLALAMVGLFGGSNNRRIVIGFMVAAAVLSMWISNTATALMLLPMAAAVSERAPDTGLRVPLLLGIAYGCSIGGIGTPIGTPPNLVFMGIYEETTGIQITFVEWMSWGLPIVAVLLPIVAWWLTRNLRGGGVDVLPIQAPWSRAEVRVMAVFAATALAWITRSEPFGGWSQALGLGYTNDAMVGFIGVFALFVINDGSVDDTGNASGAKLLDWDTANTIPWGILLLFAAGLAIAAAFLSSGLSTLVGQALAGGQHLHPLLLMLVLCGAVTFITEATSNTATTSLLLPIVAAAATAAAIDPRLLMVPVAMSASCAFMLPVATPPNVVVFSTGDVPIEEMVRQGFAANIAGIIVIGFGLYLLL